MNKRLRVLFIEDSEWDAELLAQLIRKGGYDLEYQRVESAEEFQQALTRKEWDLILADYNLPQFSAPAALAALQASGLDLPFIIVSGAIGENTAVQAMKAGADDYLMKGNLARLLPAIERELREAENRAGRRRTKEALRESELRYRLLWETATDAIILIDVESKIHFTNPAVELVFGYKQEELIGKSLTVLQPERLRGLHREGMRRYLQTGERKLNWRATETVGLRKDGTEIPIEVAFSHMELDGIHWFVGFIRDVTERKRAEQVLRQNQEQFRVAREIQQHLFPKAAPELPGFEIAGASHPADATGGDYFDYLPMPDQQLGVVVGDVTGHGVGPALLMAETRAYLRILAKNEEDTGEILTQANAALSEDVGIERFVTVLLARLDSVSRTLTYANAGHPPGYILTAAGEIKAKLTRTGVPLGIRNEATYRSSDPIQLASGDLILLLTDGFEEAISPDDAPFGNERVLQVVRDHRHRPAAKIVQALYEAVRMFSCNIPQADDLTAIVIRCR